jgi:hypothetical protein
MSKNAQLVKNPILHLMFGSQFSKYPLHKFRSNAVLSALNDIWTLTQLFKAAITCS